MIHSCITENNNNEKLKDFITEHIISVAFVVAFRHALRPPTESYCPYLHTLDATTKRPSLFATCCFLLIHRPSDPSHIREPHIQNMAATNTMTAVAESPEGPASSQVEKPSTPLSDLEKIKAAQASRRSRRARPSATPVVEDEEPAPEKEPAAASDASALVPRTEHDAALEALQKELASAHLEMSSFRRNNLQNLKKVTEERDMFASQLAKEQNAAKHTPLVGQGRKVADVEVQLRAARSRNSDLETENGMLRDEVKQLNFRVQASKTIDAATNGYESIVNDLVAVKLKCAQLQEEKEDLLRINKDLSTTTAVLTDANGDLEKSRSEWVVQCAELETKRVNLATKLKVYEAGASSAAAARRKAANQDTSYDGSDLQELKLN